MSVHLVFPSCFPTYSQQIIQDPSPVLYDFAAEGIDESQSLELKVVAMQAKEQEVVDKIHEREWLVYETQEIYKYTVWCWRPGENLVAPVSTPTISRVICGVANTRLNSLREVLRLSVECDKTHPKL